TLLGAYFALTRLIVRPVDALSQAAQRVLRGARELEVPTNTPRELGELGASLRTMTRHLRHEEEALRHQIEEVQRATDQLRSAQDTVVRSERLASVGRLAAGLAHEIGNPISALLGLQDLLLEGELTPEEQRDFVQRMKRETSRVHNILRDLLQFARPGVERPELSAPGDVGAAVDDTLALVAPQKAFHDVEIRRDIPPDLPTTRLGHEQQRDFVQRMKRETSRVHNILRDLLQFARPGVERPELSAPGDVGAAVDDTLALVAPQKAFHDVEIRRDIPPDLPTTRLGHEQ